MPLNISKISPPRLSRILDRPRLIQVLEENQDKNFILILGQAAQGKSTLAASYAQKSETQWAWINLGIEESDPVNLFYLLVQSLQYALNDVDLSPIQDYPAKAMGPREEIPLYREWTHALFDRIPVPFRIFLDGLDHLAPDAPSYGFLHVLLEDTPPDISFVMLSRTEPSLRIQRLKISQKVFIIENKDLAFTEDEVKTFFRIIRRMSFTKTQLKRIHQVTEGWVGGLVLLSESLKRLPEASRDQYISKNLPDQFKAEVFKYFGEEIFSSQSDPIQEFLIKSSIFDMVEPGFMRDFIGTENTENILQDLAKKNLFVQSIYDKQKGWMFRYHQLFKDFLKSKLGLQIDKKERSSLFFKAGSLFERKGDLEESVKFFLKAKAYPEALSIIRSIGMDLLKSERTGDLAQFLKDMPEDLVQEDPWLLFYHSMIRRFTGIRQNMLSLQKAITLFEGQGDVRGHILSLAYLIEASIIGGHYLIPLDILIEQGENLLQSLNPELYPYERAVFWSQTAYAHMYSGNPKKGFWASQHAYLTAKDLGNVTIQVNALIHAVGNLSVLGEFSLADEICSKLDKLIDQSVYPELKIFYHIHYSQLLTCRGDYEKSKKLIFMSRHEVEKRGLIYFYPIVLIFDLFLKVYIEEYAEAEEIGKHLLNMAISTDNTLLLGLTNVWMGILYYQKEDYQKARKLMDDCQQVLSSDEARAEYILGFIKIMMSLIGYHFGDYGSAEKQARDTLKYLEDIPSPLLVVDAHFATALIKWKQDQASQAATHLHDGFKIAEKRRYVHFMGPNRNDLVKICTLAIELDVKGAMDYAAHLLSTRLSAQARPEIERLSHHSNSKIRHRAQEIKRTIHRANAPHIRIETLGGFQVLQGNTSIQEKEWQGSQPKLLLKAIIAHKSCGVLQDIIAEDLWPGSRASASERNFKVTLHRLRKALEPKLDKTLGSSYIHLKDKSIFLDKDLCHVDVDEFLSLYDKGKIKEKNGDSKMALSFYERAMELYRGDFLVEDLYATWAHIKREQIRLKYIDLLYKTAQLYESIGTTNKAITCYKKVVQRDPVSEKAYQRLITLYSNRGMRSAALKIYEECRQALKTGLDTEPDELTSSLYRKVLET